MPDDLFPVYIVLALQAVGMLVITILYNYTRLKKEERKVKAAEAAAASNKAALDSMTLYHVKRLEIEEEKLAVEREKLAARNGSTPQR